MLLGLNSLLCLQETGLYSLTKPANYSSVPRVLALHSIGPLFVIVSDTVAVNWNVQ